MLDEVSIVPLGRLATRDDLDALPAHIKGEILNGVLYTMPRPRPWHQLIGGTVYSGLAAPYGRGVGGPGGWWILPEPGIELLGSEEFAPDVAAWRKERMPELPIDETISLVPDWLCEVHSPSTRKYDRTKKRDFYAHIGVPHLWLLDPLNQELTALQLVDGRWSELGVYIGDERVRVEPFPLVEFNLVELWPPRAQLLMALTRAEST